jgi:hypothetical protein
MTGAELARRVLLADCGQCWCGSQGECDELAGPLVPAGDAMVHEARIARASSRGLLGEQR